MRGEKLTGGSRGVKFGAWGGGVGAAQSPARP